MELTEKVETINRLLIDHFGVDTVTGLPIWRVVWSNDQFEKKRMDTTPAGIHLLFPSVFEVPKYPYIKDRYILERLVLVPEPNRDELVNILSYEVMWKFEDAEGNYLPPKFIAAKFVVDTVHAALGKKSLAKYKEDEKNTTEEGRQMRIKELENELFGDESGLYGKTFPSVGEGIVVPNSYKPLKES